MKTPIISVVIGEGGSGGALALGVVDRIYVRLSILFIQTYHLEGCAAILWRKDGRSYPEEFSKSADAPQAFTGQNLPGLR